MAAVSLSKIVHLGIFYALKCVKGSNSWVWHNPENTSPPKLSWYVVLLDSTFLRVKARGCFNAPYGPIDKRPKSLPFHGKVASSNLAGTTYIKWIIAVERHHRGRRWKTGDEYQATNPCKLPQLQFVEIIHLMLFGAILKRSMRGPC